MKIRRFFCGFQLGVDFFVKFCYPCRIKRNYFYYNCLTKKLKAMGIFVNGTYFSDIQRVPEGDSTAEKFRTREESIADFLENKLQNFCRDNDVKDKDILNVSVGLYGLYLTVNGRGKAKYRVKTSLNATTRRERIYRSESYVVRKEEGRFFVEPLLADEAWLIVEKVEEAFGAICKARAWQMGVRPYLCELEQEDGFKSMALATVAKDEDGEEHQILCLVTNGLIMLDAEAKLTVVPLIKTLLRVADCVFRLQVGVKGLKGLNRV